MTEAEANTAKKTELKRMTTVFNDAMNWELEGKVGYINREQEPGPIYACTKHIQSSLDPKALTTQRTLSCGEVGTS